VLAAVLALPSWGATGSRDFDGSTDYISLGASVGAYNNYTVSIWINPGDTVDWTGVAGRRLGSNYVWDIQMNVDESILGYSYQCGGSAHLSAAAWGNCDLSPTGGWYHFLMTVDDNTAMYLYLNGSQCESDTTATGSICTSTTAAAEIGSDGGDAPAWLYHFPGQLAHLSIWNRVLSAAEIAQDFRCPGSVAGGLVGYWPLWDSSTQYDLSTNSNNGTNNGTAASSDGPPIGCGKAN
jgi:hypothetical protein